MFGPPRRAADTGIRVCTKEPQYADCFAERPVTLGAMAGSTWRWNHKRLGFVLARYKHVARMLDGCGYVAEIGCADGFASMTVKDVVGHLDVYDFDPAFVGEAAILHKENALLVDIVGRPIKYAKPNADPMARFVDWQPYDAIFMLDVIEHIRPEDEPKAIRNVCHSLTAHGRFIAGAPSLESQVYASPRSRAGHVNCRTGKDFKAAMERYFHNVVIFGINDEMIHTGFMEMSHYLIAYCTEPKQ